MFPQLHSLQMAGWGSIYKPHWESSRWGWNPTFLLLTRHWSCPDRTCPVVLTFGAVINWWVAASVRSHAIGRVRSHFRRSRTSLYSTGLCCPTSGRSAASVRSSVRSLLLPSLLIKHLVTVLPASGHFYELVSSWSCIRLGSYLYAWTLLDILGLLLCF